MCVTAFVGSCFFFLGGFSSSWKSIFILSNQSTPYQNVQNFVRNSKCITLGVCVCFVTILYSYAFNYMFNFTVAKYLQKSRPHCSKLTSSKKRHTMKYCHLHLHVSSWDDDIVLGDLHFYDSSWRRICKLASDRLSLELPSFSRLLLILVIKSAKGDLSLYFLLILIQ